MKLWAVALSLVVLAGCSTQADRNASLEESMEVGRLNETVQGQPLDVEREGLAAQRNGRFFEEVALDAPQPGTQQDLSVNVGDRVFFGYDRFDLNEEARRQIELQAQWLNQYPSTRIVIEGHADERGTREYNLALGDRRANSVRNYLVALGVDTRRIETISFGKEQPAVLGSGPQVWAQNRRAVTVIE